MNKYDGQNLDIPVPLKSPTINYPISNFPSVIVYEQEYAQKAHKYQTPTLGISHHLYPNAKLAEEGSPSPMGGGLVTFRRKFIQIPTNEVYKEPVIISYTYPGKKKREAWRLFWDAGGSPNYKKVSNMVLREPRTLSVIGRQETEFINLLSPLYAQETNSLGSGTPVRIGNEIYYTNQVSPEGTFIWRNGENVNLNTLNEEFTPLVAPPNGFDFSQVTIEDGFKIHARPEARNENGSIDYIYGQQFQSEWEETDYLYDQNSSPTYFDYHAMVRGGEELQTETTMLEQFMGTFYKKIRTFVKAR